MRERKQNKRGFQRGQEDGPDEERGFVQEEEQGGARTPNTLVADGERFLNEGICNKWIYKKYMFKTIRASSLWYGNNLPYFMIVESKIRILVLLAIWGHP